MKATLTFDLSDPEDKDRHRHAVNAGDVYAVLWEFDQYLREQVKYQTEDTRDDTYAIREKFYSVMSEHGITLED
jgi:hypothetical protein